MRPLASSASLLALFAVVGAPAVARADRTRGSDSGSGGGRLGAVTSGISRAASSNSSSGGSHSSSGSGDSGTVFYSDASDVETGVPGPGGGGGAGGAGGPDTGRLTVYGAVQQVVESGGAWTIEGQLTMRRLRFGIAYSRYHEETDAGSSALSLPSVTAGLRLDDGSGPTSAFFDAGYVGLNSEDPQMTSTVLPGAVLGVHLEHRITRRVTAIGDAQVMLFDDGIRANQMRAGLRLAWIQASVRVLDFNVGPALWGPEIGLAF